MYMTIDHPSEADVLADRDRRTGFTEFVEAFTVAQQSCRRCGYELDSDGFCSFCGHTQARRDPCMS